MIYAPIPLNEIEIKVNNLTQSLKGQTQIALLVNSTEYSRKKQYNFYTNITRK